MLIRNTEKLGKRTLRERIYEEVVRLIMAGEPSSGGWVDEKRVIDKLCVSRTPFREAIGILAKGGLVEIKPYRGFYLRSLSRRETADLYELFKRLGCFAVELAVQRMSDHDIRRPENILIEDGPPCNATIQNICRTRSRILREYRRAIQKFRAHRTAGAGCLADTALWHDRKREPGVCQARRVRMRRNHTGIQGPRYSARRFSCPRPYQPYAGSDSCTLCR